MSHTKQVLHVIRARVLLALSRLTQSDHPSFEQLKKLNFNGIDFGGGLLLDSFTPSGNIHTKAMKTAYKKIYGKSQQDWVYDAARRNEQLWKFDQSGRVVYSSLLDVQEPDELSQVAAHKDDFVGTKELMIEGIITVDSVARLLELRKEVSVITQNQGVSLDFLQWYFQKTFPGFTGLPFQDVFAEMGLGSVPRAKY